MVYLLKTSLIIQTQWGSRFVSFTGFVRDNACIQNRDSTNLFKPTRKSSIFLTQTSELSVQMNELETSEKGITILIIPADAINLLTVKGKLQLLINQWLNQSSIRDKQKASR